MDNRSTEAIMLWIVTAIVTLLVLWFLGRVQVPTGPKLALMGCVFALAALTFGLLGNLLNQGTPGPIQTSGLADTALRLAAVLVLGGIVVMLLGRESGRPIAFTPEVDRNVPPSV